MNERTRQLLLDMLHAQARTLDALGGPIVRADLDALPEHVAQAEEATTRFLQQLRSLKG